MRSTRGFATAVQSEVISAIDRSSRAALKKISSCERSAGSASSSSSGRKENGRMVPETLPASSSATAGLAKDT